MMMIIIRAVLNDANGFSRKTHDRIIEECITSNHNSFLMYQNFKIVYDSALRSPNIVTTERLF